MLFVACFIDGDTWVCAVLPRMSYDDALFMVDDVLERNTELLAVQVEATP